MINVSVWYPNGVGVRVRHGLLRQLTYPHGAQAPRAGAQEGRDRTAALGCQPGPEPAFVAGCQLHFDSVEAFQAAFEPHAAAIQDDIANYTNTTPVIQINELK